ncbi:ABC transporter ATP-binding protein [Bacillus methanolicus]|uniref:ABC transporter ATP-binding protein n=1 Tax=Bacillus methanolicus (strain MGA3 / ATCC 53907) TaxID=796606 RepID=I3E963_BACMM|nr:ABC transporter ATP-binding protein [Bacillus methanolicus]AIE60289.1 ABC transporter ATP-binding protein [Bacillus methanolicus MGA3]EIJ83034.1 ABC transporter ATP-binding protein [Bacillus methanolicus MGA3]
MSHLNVKEVSKRFGTNDIIRDLSFQVEKEEFVSIIGPSGSGKSTIFHMIGGIIEPDEGTIQLENKTINGKRGEISYMPQTPSLFPWRTVLENTVLSQELKGKPDKEKAKEMLEKAGLAPYLNSYPHELSGGMKQRVAFIRALLSPQSLICLDEPFSALDELTRLNMQKWLLSIWEENRKTILFVTHNIDEALFLSDRIIVLSNKPAKVKAEFQIPFSRPRDERIMLTDDFLKWKREVFYTLQGEQP